MAKNFHSFCALLIHPFRDRGKRYKKKTERGVHAGEMRAVKLFMYHRPAHNAGPRYLQILIRYCTVRDFGGDRTYVYIRRLRWLFSIHFCQYRLTYYLNY